MERLKSIGEKIRQDEQDFQDEEKEIQAFLTCLAYLNLENPV
jgi:hypothetical protein